MTAKQISVFLENKPGQLTEFAKLLEQHGINMHALCVADAKDFGILRIIVDDSYKTCLLYTSVVFGQERQFIQVFCGSDILWHHSLLLHQIAVIRYIVIYMFHLLYKPLILPGLDLVPGCAFNFNA